MKTKKFFRALFFLLILLMPRIGFGEDLLIISARSTFLPSLNDLKRFKDASGRPTILLLLDDVLADMDYAGFDAAEQVKMCIKYHKETYGIKHVLLVGHANMFPVRHTWYGYRSNPMSPPSHWEQWVAVTDLYYADLYKKDPETGAMVFESWDSNGNTLYAESETDTQGSVNNDNVDILPDISVGRVPALDDQEVAAYVNKVIAYEMWTIPQVDWFRRAAVYTGTADSGANALSDRISGMLDNAGSPNIIRRYTDFTTDPATPPPPDPGDAYLADSVIDDLNTGLAFVSYAGHGNEDSLSCLGLQICQVRWTCRTWDPSTPRHQLANVGKWPVVFANACNTATMVKSAVPDQYLDINGVGHCGWLNGEQMTGGPYPYPYTALPRPHPIQSGFVTCLKSGKNVTLWFAFDTIAGAFLAGNKDPTSPTGAIAYLGDTMTGNSGYGAVSQEFFFKAYESGIRVLGDLWKDMIEKYHANYGLSQSNTWFFDYTTWWIFHEFYEPMKVMLLGDPSLLVGGAFTNYQLGEVYDGQPQGGPWAGFSRYRVIDDIVIPYRKLLSAESSSSVLFEHGTVLKAYGVNTNEGFIAYPDSHLLLLPATASEAPKLKGIRTASGRLQVRNGGSIKFY
jgi:hypothetical protein